MWSVPTRGTTTTRTVAGDSRASTADSFRKDGRNIRVGDCALFKPPQDSPPFIGIIRWLTLNKENNLQLGVNWLYRPAELKLGKGILLDAVPNEVFYSFHKDEIPAASLLHPCKVAFLPKGAELPSGISSFVCRRVYDIANKCLWWLTDQDYIKERQEEVDKLLYKTRIEMHATVQPGGRSPKPINGPTSTSQLKPGSENVQGATYFASHLKGKKRERADQGFEPVKRERSSRADDGDSGQFKPEGFLKSEIAKITEKGGLVDSEGVERLVQLMQPDRAERKMEMINRSMLAGVIANTDKFDCLSRFVQLRGLPVLDEWLQDVHKGKMGDGSSPKDGDKSVEEFLLVLLRALDKLPVSLHALQMCNIGKSVNHLRTSKNSEIQRKARSLVDTWKKRVEAEMNIIETKSGSTQAVSWPSRSRIPEVTHGGNRNPGGSSEVAMKSSITQLSASKNAPVKHVQGEITAKSATSSPGPMKSALSPVSGKDGQPRYAAGSTSDIPSATVKEEKSSSSSQSHNNSQSCSSDHAKTMVFSGKEDARSSTAGSISVNKFSGGGSRHRKSNNVFPGPAGSGAQRETGSSRSSSLHRNSASEKLSQSGLTCEKALDVPIAEGNSHKLIVKIPNRGRSPAQSASGGSFEDPSIMNSGASSPVHSEKHDQFDRNSKEKSDAYRANITSDVNTESWQSNDFKDVLTGSDEGDGSPPAIPDEERCGTGDDARKLAEVSKAGSSSSGSELKPGKLHGASFSSINALIESCVKFSEANASMSVGDDVGMNLLASVAAGEMSNSDLVLPTDSPLRNTPIGEDSCTGSDIKEKSSHIDNLARDESHAIDGVDEKQGDIAGTSCSKDGLHHLSKHSLSDFSKDNKAPSSLPEETPAGERDEHLKFSNLDQSTADPCLETNEKSDEVKGTASVTVPPASTTEKVMEGEGSKLHEKKAVVTCVNVDGTLSTKPKGTGSISTDDKVRDGLSSVEIGTQAVEGSSSYPSVEVNGEDKSNVNEGLNSGVHTESAVIYSKCVERTDEEVLHLSSSGKDLTSASVVKFKVEKADGMDNNSPVNQTEKQKVDRETNSTPTIESQILAGSGSAVSNQKNECMETNVEMSSGLPASITVAAAAKGPFVPPEDLLRSKGELGWKGSAATSAFRPAEPRKVLEMPLGTSNIPLPDATASKHGRPPLDIDLNVPDERVLEDMVSQNSASGDRIYI
ncbi:hypothetical protein F0562_024817 [Nyssa sinensis]|uniref:BAH domain-containing protein n=1 Tax=Nyssa sinensis TaxID=561372 RepID=A0A5J5BDW0_9ASTE|nr:hypothetical protein F0562_024817 [Nyssa sinensis]